MRKELIVIIIVAAFMFPSAVSAVYAEEFGKNIDAVTQPTVLGYGVELSCDDPIKNANPGDVIKFVVKIENTGSFDDTYEIIASSIENIVCKVNGVNADQYNPYILSLGAGESITFEVAAEIGKFLTKDEWTIVVFARSQNDSEIYDELQLTLNTRSRFVTFTSIYKICFWLKPTFYFTLMEIF